VVKARPPLPKMRRRYEVDESYWLVRRSRSFPRRALFTLRRAALTLKWGRIPNTWELSFIDRMKELENVGLTFDEVLRSTLPQLFGDDPSHVLRFCIGRKARCNAELFTRTISKMFGSSARSVLSSMEMLSDEVSLLEKNTPREPPYQSLLDAIERSEENMTVAQPGKPQGRP
jgi:hypothetical protein